MCCSSVDFGTWCRILRRETCGSETASETAVVAILQEATADGRLRLAELDSRLEVAMRAKTYADL